MVCALAAVALDASGTVTLARIGLAGAADVPLRAHGAELALVGSRPEPGLLADVAARAAADSDPVGEPHCSAEYRRHALGVVTARAVTAAVDDARRRQQRSHA